MRKEDFRFKENDKVAHIENLEQLMVVKEVKRKQFDQPTGEIDDFTKKMKTRPISKIDGILVYWFEINLEGKKIYKEQKFHSQLLVRWEIAQRGKKAADEWLESKSNFDYKQQ